MISTYPIPDNRLCHEPMRASRVVLELAPEMVDVDPDLLEVLGGIPLKLAQATVDG
jgi:hypothetical protein